MNLLTKVYRLGKTVKWRRELKLVSIIIPAYNCEKWVCQTIESALGQTWPRTEVIIVDDGSTDKTRSTINTFKAKSLKVVHKENGGVASARNYGLEFAQGDYIQWLDSDDVLAQDKIEKQMDVIENNDPDILATGKVGAFYYRIEKAAFKENRLWQDLRPLDWLLIRFSENSWAQAATWLMSRQLCVIAGQWDERLSLDEDGEYFCRLVSRSQGVKFVGSAKSYYRCGNPFALSMNRSNRALESAFFSMQLSFGYMLNIENSERTRKACVNFLQYRAIDYFLNDLEVSQKAAKLAEELGGVLSRPDINWKLRAAEKIMGLRNALMFKKSYKKIRASLIKSVDKMLFEFHRQKKKEP